MRLAGTGSQCCIGRSLDCEIVIDDSYAAERHVMLGAAGGWSPAGARPGHAQRHAGGRGAGCRRGETFVSPANCARAARVVRIRTLRVAVAAGARFPARPAAALPHHACHQRAWLLCLAFAVLSQWLSAPGAAAPRMLIAVLVTVAVLGIWVGFWSWCRAWASVPGRCASTFPLRRFRRPLRVGIRAAAGLSTCCSCRGLVLVFLLAGAVLALASGMAAPAQCHHLFAGCLRWRWRHWRP